MYFYKYQIVDQVHDRLVATDWNWRQLPFRVAVGFWEFDDKDGDDFTRNYHINRPKSDQYLPSINRDQCLPTINRETSICPISTDTSAYPLSSEWPVTTDYQQSNQWPVSTHYQQSDRHLPTINRVTGI